MEISAHVKNIRIAPRKVRLVSRVLKGKDALRARAELQYTVKRSAHPMMKVLDSALANAKNNANLVQSNLFVKDVIVNEGPKLKRYRPKGFGSSSPIQKKTSHIQIVLAERVPGMKMVDEKAKSQEGVTENSADVDQKTRSAQRRTATPTKEGKAVTGVKRRMFQRKTV